MALLERVEQEDLVLYEILRNPVLATEFIYNLERTWRDSEFKYDYYQRDFLCDFNSYVSISCARSVGKTVALTGLLIWILIFNVFPDDYIVYTVPSKVHLEPVWANLTRQFRSNSFLKNFLDRRGGINSSDFTIKPLNNTYLICRIAGTSGKGDNVIGLHSPYEIVDESGYYPYGTWIELQPTLNTDTRGFRLIVSGVPTGLRERNVNFYCDQENSNYTKHRISALQNPRFSEEDRRKAAEQYGGEDSEDYIHLVLGQHGKPVFALFDRNLMAVQTYPVFKMTLDGTKLYENIASYLEKLAIFPSLPSEKTNCIFGIDLGYTEPTAIVILYETRNGLLKFHGRVQLNKVNYYIQEKIIDYLDSKFNPSIIGIDEGSSGKSVVPRLQEAQDFLHKNYKSRLIPINFSSSIVLGTDASGNEIKSKTKPFSVGILQDYTNNQKIVYSSTDLELVTELERMTYTKTPLGDIVYRTLTEHGGKRGADHFTSAMLCMAMAYYLVNESLNLSAKKKKLIQPFWNLG